MVGGATPSTWNFGSTAPIGAKSPIFSFTHSVSAVAPSKKVPLTIIGSWLRLTSYVAPTLPLQGASKRKTADFGIKSHFAWRKSVTKFLRVKISSDNDVRHSLANWPIYLCENDWWGTSTRNLADTDPSIAKSRFSIYFRS